MELKIMNNLNFYGLTLSFFIIILILTALPLVMALGIMGPEEYGRQCKTAIHMPCFGLGE